MSVVVGYVMREDGEAALRAGVEEARRRGVPLRVIGVVKVGPGGESGDTVLELRGRLEAIEADLKSQGVDAAVKEVLSQGRPSEALLEEAKGAQLIVLGLRNRSTVGKLILGSVAQDILVSAPCPVLAVKA